MSVPEGTSKIVNVFSQARKAVLLGIGLMRIAPGQLKFFKFPASAEKLLDGFAPTSVPNSAYDDLMRYMVISWVTYRNESGTGTNYPGLPSWSGPLCDSLEGFSRLMPLFGAWCASGRDPEINLPDGRVISLPEEFRRGLLAGTDSNSPAYWGDMPGKSNQRIVEAADIALALWLFRDTVWEGLEENQKKTVADWLSLVAGKEGLDNNWHLFFVLIDRVLTELGFPGRISGVPERFDRIKEFHLGDGWFRDGPNGHVDYYSAWGFHYALTWINRIDPGFYPDFIKLTRSRFLKTYKYLIGPSGFPILGRSLHYRLAVSAPLVAGSDSDPDIVPPGMARRALDITWQYFLAKGAVRRGIISQGYFGMNPHIFDPYAGPASSLWSLRSLIMAFYFPPDHSFWNSSAEPLPVEAGDFECMIPGAGWKITGDQASGTISIEILENKPDEDLALKRISRLQILSNLVFHHPRKTSNLKARYLRRIYRSDTPFFLEISDR
ncbi:MAG: DUF2264 domain-containing protein [Cyclonatronaceae bacterium]